MYKHIALIMLSFFVLTDTAEARKRGVRHSQTAQEWQTSNPMFVPPVFQEPQQSRQTHRRPVRRSSNAQIIPHPPGCPRRAFCGCGLAVSIFGTIRRDLWLATNWLRFPRSSPASGMVAVRRGHVFKLVQQASSGNWIVEDYNSGGGLSRIHERSIAGYIIVNPRG